MKAPPPPPWGALTIRALGWAVYHPRPPLPPFIGRGLASWGSWWCSLVISSHRSGCVRRVGRLTASPLLPVPGVPVALVPGQGHHEDDPQHGYPAGGPDDEAAPRPRVHHRGSSCSWTAASSAASSSSSSPSSSAASPRSTGSSSRRGG